MPGHRRDDEPDDDTRAIPAPAGDAHGSTVAGAHAAPDAADRTPTVAGAGAPTVPAASAAPDAQITDIRTGDIHTPSTGDRPGEGTSAADRTVPTVDRTPTTPAPTPAPTVTTPVAAAPIASPADSELAPATRTQVVAAQKERFGGISWGSAFFGWLSANGVAVLLIAALSAAGVVFGLTSGLDTADEAAAQATTIGIGGGITLLVLLFLAYLAGGYVAGRMARFDGVKQGVAVWVIGLVVVLLLALAGLVFGAQYNVLSSLDLPRIPIDEGTATTAGIIALVAVLLVTLLAAVLGGLLGARYHRKVDRVGYAA
ncbi:hypothetical protein SAMN05661080_04359 [Modestobacter sp. DSM 44400]|uniref:hypothetical protein n=1 Tax=Modestobacter sp. DSM 44400 TaxID=1550230 RepID=UPI000898FD68|nr:hypothetical protein [Modestobacter sp. DSM 44400]SDY70769.1 hypothetical protein SAMN05661080_04359 [Modestobacter sp. DSM 44400]